MFKEWASESLWPIVGSPYLAVNVYWGIEQKYVKCKLILMFDRFYLWAVHSHQCS